MTAEPRPQGALVGIPEIAAIAGVQRSAVSNWRKRHSDFPAASVDTPSGVLFDLGLIEIWLAQHGKLTEGVAATSMLWRLVEATRCQPEQLRDFLISALVYLEACARARDGGVINIDDADQFSAFLDVFEDEVGTRLHDALETIELENEQLRGLLLHGFEQAGAPPIGRQLELLGTLDFVSRDHETPRFALFEDVVARTHERARFSEEYATPESVALLLARLAQNAESILDPACGEGGVLLLAAVLERQPADAVPRICGWDLDVDMLRIARSRFFLYNVDAELRCVDSLSAERDELPSVDAVVLDPPYGLKQWGDAALYLDPHRWPFGTPPPNSANLAWVQLAIAALQPGARGFVLLPFGELAKGGRESAIRREMLDAGVIEAVVLLPARLRRDTSIPIALWCVTPPIDEVADRSVLLVDASQLGVAGRSTVSLDEGEVDLLVKLLEVWFERQAIEKVDERITAVALRPSEIDGANLQPAHYVHEPKLDRTQLVRERDKLIKGLGESSSTLAAALREIVKKVSI